MKAVVFHGVGDIRLDDVPEPTIEAPTDAIIRITAAAICGTDLHMVRGTMPGMKSGTILGHEGVGIVEEIGSEVKDIKVGDRVVVCSTIGCGKCAYCKASEYASCDVANPNGPAAGTAFFGGPKATGPFNGLQAERARIPYADTVLVKVPEGVSDEDALLTSDIFPTGLMAAEIADVHEGDIVAVFGCGPVGQMAIASANLLGASKVIAVDCLPDRLELARKQGAICVNYEHEDPVETLKASSNGYGPDACIDAVGVDAQGAHEGPAHTKSWMQNAQNFIERKAVAPVAMPFGNQWRQGDAPSQVLTWCVQAVRKSGVVAIAGVYPETAKSFPIGLAMQKCLTVRASNCSHRKYIPRILEIISKGSFHPSSILTRTRDLADAIECYEHFDKREPGWVKVELVPQERRQAA